MNVMEVMFSGAMWLALPIAALAGLISFISPCVLPLVPGYLGFISGAVAPREPVAAPSVAGGASGGGVATRTAPTTPVVARNRLVWGVVLFIAGFTVVFVFFFVLGGTLGMMLIRYQDIITRVLGVFVMVMGFVFVGLFGFAQRTFRPKLREGLGLAGAPLLGVAMGIGWAPCIGPTLSAIFSISLSQADPWRAGLLGFAYAMGLGIPFILLAVGFGWASRTVGFLRRHIRLLNIIGGALLVLLGLLMVTGVWTSIMSQLGVVAGSVQLPI